MKYKNFSQDIWQQIKVALREEKKTNPTPVAAFDADGTLWDTDLGESFFKYQIKHNLLPEIFGSLKKDPWRHYRDWKESGDPRPAYLWLAQINQGLPLATIQKWAEENVASLSPLPIFEDQKKLIEFFLQENCRVFIVTASIKWAVEPGAKRLGISAKDVLGIETRIENGIITTLQSGDITYREGKLTAILKATGGVKPFFATGNTMGDFWLLEGATRVRLAVGAAGTGHELRPAEEKLHEEALARGWLVHRFA
jgi:HAD superfamily phosphoserine phosphatase-like hydrolase